MRSDRPAPGDRPAGLGALRLSAGPALKVALAGAALTLTGFAVVGPTLAVPGAALVLLGLLAPLWVLAVAAQIRLEARPLSATVVEGRPLEVEITVGGRRLFGIGGAELDHGLLRRPLALGEALARHRVPGRPRRRPGSRRPERFVLTARAQGRGLLTLAPPRLTVTDPLGLARTVRSANGEAGTLLVLPRTEPVHWLTPALRDGASKARIGVAAAHGVDISGLRDYQPGTPATRIHWPALARGSGLLERVFATETQVTPLVVVDPRAGRSAVDLARLDAAIRAAASLTLALAQTGSVDLLLPGRTVPLRITASLAAWPAAHRGLALIAATGLTAAPPQVSARGLGVLFYACSDAELVAAAQHRWGGELLTVVPQIPGTAAPEAALRVAGCVATPVRGGA
jgi:uncharacterized protein (DUF58 family)